MCMRGMCRRGGSVVLGRGRGTIARRACGRSATCCGAVGPACPRRRHRCAAAEVPACARLRHRLRIRRVECACGRPCPLGMVRLRRVRVRRRVDGCRDDVAPPSCGPAGTGHGRRQVLGRPSRFGRRSMRCSRLPGHSCSWRGAGCSCAATRCRCFPSRFPCSPWFAPPACWDGLRDSRMSGRDGMMVAEMTG